MAERLFVRILMGSALCTALLAFALVSVPVDAKGDPELPAPAFEQVGLYRLEAALLVFYGSLLLVTPAFSGLVRGRLPNRDFDARREVCGGGRSSGGTRRSGVRKSRSDRQTTRPTSERRSDRDRLAERRC